MNRKYGRRENIRKQLAILEEKKLQKTKAYYSSAVLIISNSLFFSFFSWTFFEKELNVNLIPFLLAIVNSFLIKYIIDGFFENSKGLLCAILSFLPFLFLFTVIKEQISKNELNLYGQNTDALIFEKKWHSSYKSPDYWVVAAEFKLENKLYKTFFVKDEEGKFKVGDSTEIIYSTRNPEINKLNELEK